MAMENKPGFNMEGSANYGGEQMEDENQNYSQNGRIYPEGGSDNKMNIRENYEGEE